MPAQSYANHTHRPTLTVVAFACLVVSMAGFVMRWLGVGGGWTAVMGIAGLLAAVMVLIAISRVYTTALQDRIIRLEMRARGATLLTPQQMATLLGLNLRRIAALRFASDQELPALLERTARENLTPDQIKRAITTWMPDVDRT